MGVKDNPAYADGLLLLQVGADLNRSAADGITLGKMLKDHRSNFERAHKSPPADFAALWDWAEQHGILQ
jgi:hypothetical protein